MPLHDVGYRPWRGRRLRRGAAVGVIALTGLRLAWTSRWLRRALLVAWMPCVLFAIAFFAFEQAAEDGQFKSIRTKIRMDQALDNLGLLGAVLADTLAGQPNGTPRPIEELRHTVWSRLLLAFMRAPQASLLAIVVGLIAPSLISRDLRAKAWLVYFTRPVTAFDYVGGKLVVLAVFVAAITMLPALALWVLGVLVSPDLSVVLTTWDLPLRIVAATVALALPTVLMALAYSSLTVESRIASFAWFATWAACWIAHGALVTADMVAAQDERQPPAIGFPEAAGYGDEALARERPPRRRPPEAFRWLQRAAGLDQRVDGWSWISPYHALGVVQAAIFGVETRRTAIVPPALSLAAICVVSSLVLLSRANAPARS
ncbi:MAG: hypothetical protein ACKOCW_07590 [Planctomycetaceae bacterium]